MGLSHASPLKSRHEVSEADAADESDNVGCRNRPVELWL